MKQQDLEQTFYDLIEAAKHGLLGAVNESSTCFYHNDDKYCAIGYLLPEHIHNKIDDKDKDKGEHSAPVIESSVQELIAAIPEVENILEKHSLTVELAQELQIIHDGCFTNFGVPVKERINAYVERMKTLMERKLK